MNVQWSGVRDAGAGSSPGIVDVGESLLVGVHGGDDEGWLRWVVIKSKKDQGEGSTREGEEL